VRLPALEKHGMAALLDPGLDFRLEQLSALPRAGAQGAALLPQLMTMPREEGERLVRAGEGVC